MNSDSRLTRALRVCTAASAATLLVTSPALADVLTETPADAAPTPAPLPDAGPPAPVVPPVPEAAPAPTAVPPPAPVVDRDGDQVGDPEDDCPDVVGDVAHRGCPAPLGEVEPEVGKTRAQKTTESGTSRKTDKERKERKERKTDKERKEDAQPSSSPGSAAAVPETSGETPGVMLDGPPASVRVPDELLEGFRTPLFLLPIYQAAGAEYGIRWEILAAINEIETDYGRNLNVSSAGAQGWMQFMPPTWKAYGVDANRDGKKDPYNPVDATFAAARYLKAAGAKDDLRKAIFAYNHADWYVNDVLRRARRIAGLPDSVSDALSGLASGLVPMRGKVQYSQEDGSRALHFSTPDARAVGVASDGVIVEIGRNAKYGRFVRVRDAWGNRYTYSGLSEIARDVARVKSTARDVDASRPHQDPAPKRAATAGRRSKGTSTRSAPLAPRPQGDLPEGKVRLRANPERPSATVAPPERRVPKRVDRYFLAEQRADLDDLVLRPLKVGQRVSAGTIIGRTGTATTPGRLRLSIRPARSDGFYLDARPVVRSWRALRDRKALRVRAGQASIGGQEGASAGQVLLLSKEALVRRVLGDRDIEIYEGGRRDIQAGIIDRRVLATLAFLSAKGHSLVITSLRSGHSIMTASGNVSAHSTGSAVDIAAVDGITITPSTQGRGSITEKVIRELLGLQGPMEPSQIISLMKFDGAGNTLAMSDHGDHIHVGFRPVGDAESTSLVKPLSARQWKILLG